MFLTGTPVVVFEEGATYLGWWAGLDAVLCTYGFASWAVSISLRSV